MAELSNTDRLSIAKIRARRANARAAGKLWRLPILRWRFGLPIADRFTIIPRDLRVADPSFMSEIALGQFGLAGHIAQLNNKSPFEIRPPNEGWARELHGFGWLRHLRGVRSDEERQLALDLVKDWIKRAGGIGKQQAAWQPGVMGRRITSWICAVPMLLKDIPQKDYDLITDSLGAQLVELSSRWREADHDLERLSALIALMQAMLCVSGHDGEIEAAQTALTEELGAQIHTDGGHVSRNPAFLIELLLDCLPLRQCFVAREMEVPVELQSAISRMMAMLRYMRLGDGTIARFNGMGATPVDEAATVLAYEQSNASTTPQLGPLTPQSHYARLHAGETVIVIDAGPPPPIEYAGHAHAGCLSFEMCSGRTPILINGGRPGPAHSAALAAARSTVSHNTLCVNDTSSSKIIRSDALKQYADGYPIRDPAKVKAKITAASDGAALEFKGSHDGYLQAFGVRHRRTISLGAAGNRVTGKDCIGTQIGGLRLAKDAPYAIHFQLHPDIACEMRAGEGADNPDASVLLTTADGQTWQFDAPGGHLTIEQAVHFSDSVGPRATLQIVLRGASFGETEVFWSLALL